MTSGSDTRSLPQVHHTTGDTQFNVRDAALRGASSAFSKPPVKPKPQINTYTGGNNGALLAATKVSTSVPRQAPPQASTPLKRDWTGSSNAGRPTSSPMQLSSKSNSSGTLGLPEDNLFDRTSSPSNIAAKLAAARYSPMKPVPPASATRNLDEHNMDEQDIFPSAGHVGHVLSKLDTKVSNHPPWPEQQMTTKPNVSPAHSSIHKNSPADNNLASSTTSLMNLFEGNAPKTPRTQQPLQVSHRAPPVVKSPKPQRKIQLPPEPQPEMEVQRTDREIPPAVKPKPRPKPKPKPMLDGPLSRKSREMTADIPQLRKSSRGESPNVQKTFQSAAVTASPPPPQPASKGLRKLSRSFAGDTTPPASLARRLSTSMSMASYEDPSSPASFVSAQEEQDPNEERNETRNKEVSEKVKPDLPPPRRSRQPKVEGEQAEPQMKPSSRPPKPYSSGGRSPSIHIPEQFPRPSSTFASSPPTDTIYHSNYQRESVKIISKHMTGESLSNAIVGAALASSRNASPKPPSTSTTPIPAQRHHHHHSPFRQDRSPSPTKPTGKLRTTLRKEPSSSSDEDEGDKYRKKGTRVMGMRRKHPNKHHEGDRKRWRDSITERERKRYEGVWAANKGLYVQTGARQALEDDSTNDVCNLVTKEIWTRSRLADDVLEEVWDLVDGRGIGRLRREEFVVGLWLVDQRLKGRKLPPRVSESVWGSVRGIGGLKVNVSHR
ncbi:hypothetical protein BU24DRAFT_371635 [Aaosphaeria arxii CBS 175.79]|uniref:EH domain-containing protein n=1 Tax=Aaosphaeria arxii CBS 175.79 TaxID=1450172 RepID=A0A6A5XQ41_9PLEO|nr:uncharacterized protein BU24DRAFT_371635 [Aaosphaeria arxii CBS 175.79]KAF2014840.1 hypothetical protein BU24DRAFT_371635 [Aaosphaeria arxii CBS 175.79]